MTELLLLFSTPIFIYIPWGVFTLLQSGVTVSLVALLITSVTLPAYFMDIWKVFWPCSLLIIVMTTGLMVIFAYMVSLSEKGENTTTRLLPSMCMVMLALFFSCMNSPFGSKIYHPPFKLSISTSVSFMLILLLLLLVISFIRLVYSKGGGFRKKF